MRALIIGVDGSIGRALAEALVARADEVVGTTRREASGGAGARVRLDLADPAVGQVRLPQCDVAVICAAMARFADCREKPELARAVNVTAPAALARQVVEAGGHVVLLSTSAVFDCRTPHMKADAPTSPTSAYGRLKAQAEPAVLASGDRASVLRLTKVLTPDNALIGGWVAALMTGRAAEAFSDLTISPMRVCDIVSALLAVVDDRGGGIYQASGAGDISYADIARHIARRLGADPALVSETLATRHGIPEAEVTRFTSLDTSRLGAVAGFAAPRAEDVLDEAFPIRVL